VTRYQRCPGLVATASASRYLFIVPGRSPVMLEDIDVPAMAELLECAALPIARDALLEAVDEQAVATLLDLGVLIEAPEGQEEEAHAPRKRCKTLVIGLSGAISVIHAHRYVVELAHRFAENVEVIVSEGARAFVRPEVFTYHGLRVWTDPFTPAHGIAVPHAHLASVADAVLVAPASANMLHKLATGACSDLISLVVAATSAPVIVAPSTNPTMWKHPPIQRNIAQLRADGAWVIDPWLGTTLRQQVGVGVLGFSTLELVRALDVILPRSPEQ
jgi:phosphopantothenoylcysteine decarboxylase/phosphopantothenate--cysteine ligase